MGLGGGMPFLRVVRVRVGRHFHTKGGARCGMACPIPPPMYKGWAAFPYKHTHACNDMRFNDSGKQFRLGLRLRLGLGLGVRVVVRGRDRDRGRGM